MTNIIKLFFDTINKIMNLLKGFEFEFFGTKTNFLYVVLSFLVIYMSVKLIKLGVDNLNSELGSESVTHRFIVNSKAEKTRVNNARAEKRKLYDRGGRWI